MTIVVDDKEMSSCALQSKFPFGAYMCVDEELNCLRTDTCDPFALSHCLLGMTARAPHASTISVDKICYPTQFPKGHDEVILACMSAGVFGVAQ